MKRASCGVEHCMALPQNSRQIKVPFMLQEQGMLPLPGIRSFSIFINESLEIHFLNAGNKS